MYSSNPALLSSPCDVKRCRSNALMQSNRWKHLGHSKRVVLLSRGMGEGDVEAALLRALLQSSSSLLSERLSLSMLVVRVARVSCSIFMSSRSASTLASLMSSVLISATKERVTIRGSCLNNAGRFRFPIPRKPDNR